MAAASRNNAAAAIVKTQTNPTDSNPAGSALDAVRGFFASKLRSAMRLNAIAAERAPTIAPTIQRICHGVGSPRAARTAPRKANGNAKSVCSIFIISNVSRVFLSTVDTVYQILPKKHTSHKPLLDTKVHSSQFLVMCFVHIFVAC